LDEHISEILYNVFESFGEFQLVCSNTMQTGLVDEAPTNPSGEEAED